MEVKMEKEFIKGGCGHSSEEVEKSGLIAGFCMLIVAVVLFVALVF